jgi:hypothetical protein
VLPDFDDKGNLPPGIYWVEWHQFEQRFGLTLHRRRLLAGLLQALQNLRAAGCAVAYIDGSFITSKDRPSDFDGCWSADGVRLDELDPVLKIFSEGRALQKAKYFGELFPLSARADGIGRTFLAFFQTDKSTGEAKGIVALRLEGLPR